MTTIRRGFVNIGDADSPTNIHYYTCGVGPAVFLLHASPASGAVFLPVLERIGQYATAIAVDTPGYGFSDSLVTDVADLTPYVEALESLRRKLGFNDVVIYGSATGSQIATEYAKTYTSSCRSVILDNAADFQAGERDQMLDCYFPNLAPDFAGSHLSRVWSMATDLMRFFPWHWNSHPQARLPAREIDATMVHGVALQYLQAGRHYDRAYRVAFANENAANMRAITIPTTIIRSSASIVKRYTDRFDDYTWPDNVRMLHCGSSIEERQQAMLDTIAEYTAGMTVTAKLAPPSDGGKQIVAHEWGDVAARRTGSGDYNWLFLHDIGGSSASLTEITLMFGASGRVFAPDLPGHGASDDLDNHRHGFIETCDSMLLHLIEAMNIETAHVVGVGSSAAVAISLMQKKPERVSRLTLLDPVIGVKPTPQAPKMDGSHLIALWHELRNSELYWPCDSWTADSQLQGVPDLLPEHTNRALIDRLLSTATYCRALEEVNDFPIVDALEVTSSVTIARTNGSTSADRSRRTFPIVPATPDCVLPDDLSLWPEMLSG